MSAEMNRRYTDQLTSINPEEPSPWFKNWFDSSYYHKLYANRNDEEAASFIDALQMRLKPTKGAKVLDLGCGAGRHSKVLASKGNTVVGIDLAGSSIASAKQHESSTLRFHQHDMRMAFGRDHFNYVFNFFTSFGYFESDEENSAVVRNISNSLTQGGVVMIDYLNVHYAEKRETPNEIKEIDGDFYYVSRWMDASHFYKKIEIRDADQKMIGTHVEKVGKLVLGDFVSMFERHGLKLFEVCGDYALNDFNHENSPRLVMMARKR